MSTTGKPFIENSSLDWEDVGGGLTRKILGNDDNLMVVRVHFEKGGIGPLHSHPHTQVSYVLEGVFEVSIDGKKQKLIKGDSFYVAPDLEHGAVCLEEGELIDVFTPTREDFLS